ncbi:hypothetical protein [Shewanella glacialipiscicola]|uniref:hypothetical protein n=1 Tax=Shewanella glacialipiscicola TaxID=614069 RepID=UPI003D78F66E
MTTERKRRLTPREWSGAVAMYESGEFTLEQISEKYSVHVVTVQRYMSKNGIEKGSKSNSIKRKVEERLAEDAEEEVSLIVKRTQETKEEHYRICQAIDKRIARELITSGQDDKPISASINNLKALKIMAETLKITREARYTILGVTAESSDVDDLPSLEVREMLDSEIKEIRDSQKAGAQIMGEDGDI